MAQSTLPNKKIHGIKWSDTKLLARKHVPVNLSFV